MSTPLPPNNAAPILALEQALAELRVAYDRYLSGLDRAEPSRARTALKTALRAASAHPPKNTALAFRLGAIKASLVAQESHWDRVSRQMEAGILPRQRPRAAAPPPTQASAGPPRVPMAQPMSDTEALYRAYIAPGMQRGEPAMAKEAFVALVGRQLDAVRKKTGWEDVALRVSVEDGKPILRARRGGAQEASPPPPVVPIADKSNDNGHKP